MSRVNLIVGKNNAGKSAFLEAIELHVSDASLSVIIELVETRQETWTGAGQINPNGLDGNPLRHLFYRHNFPDIDGEGIFLGEINDSDKLHIKIAAYTTEYEPGGEFLNRIRVTNVSPNDLEDIELYLVAEEGNKLRRIIDLSQVKKRFGSRYPNSVSPNIRYPWQVVHTANMSNRKVASLWDLTSLTELESEVINALKLIEPRVTGVAFVEESNSRNSSDSRIPIVKIDGIKEPLPLKSMGDGMTRLFHIIVALVNAQNGILLVDEFENGLYWKVQPKVWDVVFQLADRLNVQVFATTHSRDCIRAFDEAWNKYPQSGAFFRLDARPEGVKITEYNAETLTDAIETDVEVR